MDSGRPESAAVPAAASPMLAQYLEIKRAHAECLLFFHLGDFYELFFDDAVTTAKALGLTLTRRGRQGEADIPMCGVPVHAAEGYIARLIRQGHRVALCEQVEDAALAKKRGGKAIVRREVVRIVTPGTVVEDALLDPRRNNYLAVLAEAGGQFGLAWADLSTGEFRVETLAASALSAALHRLAPGEIVLADRTAERPEIAAALAEFRAATTTLPAQRFDSDAGARRLAQALGVAALDGFGDFGRAELSAAGALVDYVEATQKSDRPHLSPPRRASEAGTMAMDAATRRNLELTATMTGERDGSLLAAIDRTLTGAGARLLAQRLAAPLIDPAAIAARLDAVGYFFAEGRRRAALRDRLKAQPDIERALSRLALGRGGPRDLAGLRDGLAAIPDIRSIVEAPGLAPVPAGVQRAARALGEHRAFVERLARALGPDLPLLARDGGFIAAGYDARLDELKTLRDESRRLTASLQARYSAETAVASLKVKHNNVIGYHIEVPAAHADKLMAASKANGVSPFVHRQTMAGAVRFSTAELADLETRIVSAADKALALEIALFADLVGEVTKRAEDVGRAARALAALDVASALAELAEERNYCRPTVDDSAAFVVRGGRHASVERALARQGAASFTPNDCALAAEGEDSARLWLLTGPNMAGKSTFLRQNALIAILAQMGSFVPAREARLGAVDRLFSRVGAGDDLARGRSTFMVEMVETAAILNRAGPRSLVILDEIGRGTATFDGLSIAWATLEHLHEVNRCRALFATHYHELTALAGRLDGMATRTMRVKEWRGDVVFLHEVGPGAADRSYGIHVARLAGLPDAVIARAEQVLAALERGDRAEARAKLADDLPLFSAARPKGAAAAAPSAVETALADLRPDELSPKDALDALYRLRALLRDGQG